MGHMTSDSQAPHRITIFTWKVPLKCILCSIFLATCLLAGPGRAEAVAPKLPFFPGEKLTYSGRWGMIPAGEVTLEVLPKETLAGVSAYHFAMTTKTNSGVDLMYKIRERQDSYVDLEANHSVLYKKRTESKHPRDIIINFDWNKLEATRANFGKKSAPLRIAPGSFDPLALFYILRLQDLKENAVVEFPITDGDMNIMVKATINKKELVTIKGKTYETYAINPDMERLEKVVSKNKEPQLKIWLSADAKKIPIKIQSSIGIVSFIFELESIEP